MYHLTIKNICLILYRRPGHHGRSTGHPSDIRCSAGSPRRVSDLRILPAEQRPTIRGKILDRRERPVLRWMSLLFSCKSSMNVNPLPRSGAGGKLEIRREIHATMSLVRKSKSGLTAEAWQKIRSKSSTVPSSFPICLPMCPQEDIIDEIDQINDRLWEMARRIWWRRRNRNKSWNDYFATCDSIEPEKIITIDLYEMHKSYPLDRIKKRTGSMLQAQLALVHHGRT